MQCLFRTYCTGSNQRASVPEYWTVGRLLYDCRSALNVDRDFAHRTFLTVGFLASLVTSVTNVFVHYGCNGRQNDNGMDGLCHKDKPLCPISEFPVVLTVVRSLLYVRRRTSRLSRHVLGLTYPHLDLCMPMNNLQSRRFSFPLLVGLEMSMIYYLLYNVHNYNCPSKHSDSDNVPWL